MKTVLRVLSAFAIAASVAAMAAPVGPEEDQSRRVGDFEIYYSASPLAQLPQQVIKRYNLHPAADAAMLQVTVRRDNGNGTDSAVKATISGTAKGLAAHPMVLNFVEHADDKSPLYIAEFTLSRPDTLVYTLHVSADGLPDQEITFQRDYAPD